MSATPRSCWVTEQHKRVLLNALAYYYGSVDRGSLPGGELETERVREVYEWLDVMDGPLEITERP